MPWQPSSKRCSVSSAAPNHHKGDRHFCGGFARVNERLGCHMGMDELIDLFADYKTGKEIRLYKEQHLIGKIATEKILTDGEKTLKQISMRTAKTSSIVAVMGAFVAFGVYVFIGVKGNLGQFGAV